MNKSILVAAVAALTAVRAGAWEVNVLTGGTNIMVAPPAHSSIAASTGKARTALETISQGEYRRHGAGLIIALIRAFGGYPEGTTYGILIMNILTPLIDRMTRGRIYGEVKARA